ncbi:archease [Patescibacteria group bacterium]|nr:archease [Patescibacteria group bacterium]
MKKYKILEHKADLKIRASGKTKEKLFLNMLFGMAESQRAEIKRKKKIKREIKIKSLDFAALLVDFLSEALYLSQVNKEAYSSVKFTKLTNKEIDGELIGQKVERFGEDIKAVTHHDLNIHQRKDGIWEATVLFDI